MGERDPALERYAELLRQEEGIYREVLDISRQQSALVEKGSSTELLEVLAAKGELVRRLETIGEELTPLKEGWKERREACRDNERAEIEALLESISGLLEKIIAEENSVEKLIGAERSEAVERIKRLQTGRKMNKAYGDQSRSGGRFTDSKR